MWSLKWNCIFSHLIHLILSLNTPTDRLLLAYCFCLHYIYIKKDNLLNLNHWFIRTCLQFCMFEILMFLAFIILIDLFDCIYLFQHLFTNIHKQYLYKSFEGNAAYGGTFNSQCQREVENGL